VDVTRVLHIVRSRDPDALPAATVAEADVLVYTYVPAVLPARAWLLWPAQTDEIDQDPTAPAHVPIIDTAALCQLVFDLDSVAVW
jgi:hypothetical protein